MTQEEIREKYNQKVQAMRRETIANETGIPKEIISRFSSGKRDLWPEHLQALNDYLEKH